MKCGKVELEEFFYDREQRYLDFAGYECKQAGIGDEYEDLYMEVMLSFFEGDRREKAISMINSQDVANTKKNQRLKKFLKENGSVFPLCEFDFFFLRTLKLNAISPRAPYRWNYHRQPSVDSNADYSRLEIEEKEYDSRIDEKLEKHLSQFDEVREVANEILTEDELKVFTHTFLGGEPACSFQEFPEKIARKFVRTSEDKIKGYFEVMKRTHCDSAKLQKLKESYVALRDNTNKLNNALSEGSTLRITIADLRKLKSGDNTPLEALIKTCSLLENKLKDFMKKTVNDGALSNVELNFFQEQNNQLRIMNELTSHLRNQCTVRPEIKDQKTFVTLVGKVINDINALNRFILQRNIKLNIFPSLSEPDAPCIFDPNADQINYDPESLITIKS